MPSFWDILRKARDEGVSLINLSSHGRYVLSYSFDKVEFDHILSFLGVEPVDNDWYAKCIQGTSNLVTGVSEDVYLELLLFIADNWWSKFSHTHIKNIPLIKCVGYGSKSLCSISATQKGDCKICLSSKSDHVSWLINWNGEFLSSNNSLIFMPKGTQDAMELCSRKGRLKKWLGEQAKVRSVSVYEYADDLLGNLPNAKKLVIVLSHFLYQSWCESYISDWEAGKLCKTLPLVDKYGRVIRHRTGVLVPAKGSKWACLTDLNLWINEGYVELSEDYLNSGYFAGTTTPQKKLLEFIKCHAEASDVPDISAPSDSIPSLSAPLEKQNALLLLDWIYYLLRKHIPIPQKFLRSIKEGCWLKVTLNGSPGFRPPSQSFLLSSRGDILQNSSVLVEIPLVDQNHYGERINSYKEELKTIGVRFEFGEACEYMGKHLMSLAASSFLTADNVLSVLRFIKLLRKKLLSPEDFIYSIKEGRWLKTSLGFKSPVGSVLSDEEWIVASKVSDIPIIDHGFYGKDIYEFKTELELLGVAISFSKCYQLVIDNLKSPSCLTSWTPDVLILLLKCMSLSGSSEKLVRTLKEAKCLKTKDGDKCPEGCLLFDSEWGCILEVFSGLPMIVDDLYGDKISSYKNELKNLGVVVDFEKAVEAFTCYFTEQAASASITNENVASFLLCYRKLQGKFPAKPKSCICEVKWLRTRLGDYRSPKECILFSHDWDFISPICRLPFIDDSDKYYGKNIHEHKEELKSLGVLVEFKDGVKFVESGGLHLPQNLSCISKENVLALLECIKILLQEEGYSLSEDFLGKVSQPWLKTPFDYRPPSQCLLFDSEFGKFLKKTDGPFLDEEFYGNKITAYKKELSAIGVIVDAKDKRGCSLIAGHLDLHEESSSFVRVYNYLSESDWEPERNSEAVRKVWIPKRNQKGEWVIADECVLHGKEGLFGLQLTVLEKHYERKLLSFFSCAFGVKSNPSLDDYLKLWKIWESSESGLSHDQCCKFWGYVSKHWQTLEKNTLADAIMKVPVNSGTGGIMLCKKQDIFIGDDLQLQLLFQQSGHNVFVWYPQASFASLPRSKLLEIYQKIGVRTISESVQKEETLTNDAELMLVPTEKLFGKVLLRLILSFLAGPSMEMDAEKRQKAIQGLVNVSVVESTKPIAVSYNLELSSGEILNVKGSRKMRWDREESKFFTQKMKKSGGQKSVIEFATYFSEAISECVLWGNIDHIGALCELIKLAFVLKLNEEAVGFLLQSKNLQIFEEDEEFLKAAYP